MAATTPAGGTKPTLTMTQRVQARAAKDPAFAARAQTNPGLRSMLKTSSLTPAQAAQRQLNLRLNAPITPGSSITQRDLAHQAKNAVDVQYGPADRQASQLTQQVPAYFTNYLAALQQHSAATKAAEDDAVTQDQQLQAGVRGLDQTSASQMQSAAAQDAANRGATAGDTTATADQASQVRQAMLAALGSQQAGIGAAQKSYADALANVVGPGQQLTAQQQAGQKLLGIRAQEGAANQQYRSDATASEAKNVLANQALVQGTAIKTGNLKIAGAKVAATAAKNRTDAQLATAKLKAQQSSPSAQKTAQQVAFFNQHGYYPATGGPKTGPGAKTPAPKSGPGSLNPAAESKIVSQIHRVAGVITGAVGSTVNVGTAAKPKNIKLTHDAVRRNLSSGKNPLGQPIDPRIVGIAFDLAAGKPLSPHSVQLAHDLGIHVGKHFKTASTLKVKAKPVMPASSDPAFGPLG